MELERVMENKISLRKKEKYQRDIMWGACSGTDKTKCKKTIGHSPQCPVDCSWKDIGTWAVGIRW